MAVAADLITKTFNDLPIRLFTIDGDPWFVAADVCKVLGIANHSDACSRLDPDEISRFNRGKGRPSLIVSESGVYALINQSRKPAAVKFQRWVRKEVLPSIRKDGAYIMGESFEVDMSRSEGAL